MMDNKILPADKGLFVLEQMNIIMDPNTLLLCQNWPRLYLAFDILLNSNTSEPYEISFRIASLTLIGYDTH